MEKRDFILDLHYMAYNKFTSPWEIEKRALPDYEFLYIVSGRGHLSTDQGQIPVQAQDLILVPPDFLHSMHSDELPFELWCIHFNAYVQPEQKGTPYVPSSRKGQINGLFLPKWHTPGSQPDLQLCQITMDLVTHLNSSLMITLALRINELMKTDLAGNIAQIRRLLCGILESSSSTKSPQHPAEPIKTYIETHFSEKITLSLLSSLYHFQPSYISSLFKKQYGITVTEYINRCRITAAKSYLSYTEDSLEEIARKTGFFDTSHFCKTFSSKEGLPPAKYRSYTRTENLPEEIDQISGTVPHHTSL